MYDEDFRVPVGARRGGMDMQLAEQPAERLVLLQGQRLIAEENHLMRHQCIVDFREGLVAERLRQVDAGNLGPDHRVDR